MKHIKIIKGYLDSWFMAFSLPPPLDGEQEGILPQWPAMELLLPASLLVLRRVQYICLLFDTYVGYKGPKDSLLFALAELAKVAARSTQAYYAEIPFSLGTRLP
jgi:hypothetical protein